MLYHFIYRALLYPLLLGLFKSLAIINPKVKLALKLRRPINSKWPWLNFKSQTKPVWFHCSSGEFEYARPVIQALKMKNPNIKIMLTYFSPSIVEAVQKFELIDFSTPLPWDEPKILAEFLTYHQPQSLLIARTDAWPELLFQCRKQQVPSMMFAATLAQSSSRMNFLAKKFTGWTLGMLDEIQCVTKDDFENFKTLGLGDITKVSGDTRYDQVIARLKNPKAIKSHLFEIGAEQKILVAGSTWPEDEEVLVELISLCLRQNLNYKFVIVPHEPTSTHLSSLIKLASKHSLKAQVYSSAKTWDSGQILIVDQIGILAEIYSHAAFAFVGGSFKKSVHSVMEPLAAGCVSFVGPKHHNNREALDIKGLRLKCAPSISPVIEVSHAKVFFEKLKTLESEKIDLKLAATEIKDFINNRSGRATQSVLNWLESQEFYRKNP